MWSGATWSSAGTGWRWAPELDEIAFGLFFVVLAWLLGGIGPAATSPN